MIYGCKNDIALQMLMAVPSVQLTSAPRDVAGVCVVKESPMPSPGLSVVNVNADGGALDSWEL